MIRPLGALLLLALAAGCAGGKPAPEPEPAPVPEADTLAAWSREDSLRVARSLFLLALDLENRDVSAGTADLVSRAFSYDPGDRWLGFRALEARLRAGQVDSAAALVGRVRALPGDTTATQALLLGQTLRFAGKPDSALAELRAGLAIDDENVRLLFETVLTLETLKRYPEMASAHMRLTELLEYPDEMVSKQLVLNTLVRDTAAQEKLYRALWERRGEQWGRQFLKWLIEAKRHSDGADVAIALLRESPDDEDLATLRTWLLLQSGRGAEARAALDSVWRKDTADAKALRALATVETELRELDSAVVHWSALAALDSGNAATFFFLASSHALKGDNENALAAIRRARRLQPTAEEFPRQEGLILTAMGRFDSVYALAAELELLFPGERFVDEMRATAQVRQAFSIEEDPARRREADSLFGAAIPTLRKRVLRDPVAVSAIFDLASALERTGKFDESRVHFERILAHDPNNSIALNYFGYSLLIHGDSSEWRRADTLITRALALEPANASYIDSKAWAFHRLGNDSAALELLLSIENDEEMRRVEFFEHQAEVLESLGRTEEALQTRKKLLELFPEHAKTLQDPHPEGDPERALPEEAPVPVEPEKTALPPAPAKAVAP